MPVISCIKKVARNQNTKDVRIKKLLLYSTVPIFEGQRFCN